MLKQMLNDLGFERTESIPRGIPLPSVEGEALGKILKWLEIHANEEPRSEEERQMHRFQPKRRQGGQRALRHLRASTEAGGCDNAAYYLEMPDLTDSLIKYTANNLEGKEAAKMAEWLAIPQKKDRRTSGRRRRKTTKREDRLKKEDAIEQFLTSD
ncbi:hypothetical protein L596_029355 [Steinernema carpocapsae]|uniref:SKP1 component POZ domain-containing protein n=1 Tax=Steinernema carpocapsae TaxID=34508 RepID=A0A4U5LUD5_STECR|nr:hypothetical protein L596_029355 [Steinernema carpocapsae]